MRGRVSLPKPKIKRTQYQISGVQGNANEADFRCGVGQISPAVLRTVVVFYSKLILHGYIGRAAVVRTGIKSDSFQCNNTHLQRYVSAFVFACVCCREGSELIVGHALGFWHNGAMVRQGI